MHGETDELHESESRDKIYKVSSNFSFPICLRQPKLSGDRELVYGNKSAPWTQQTIFAKNNLLQAF